MMCLQPLLHWFESMAAASHCLQNSIGSQTPLCSASTDMSASILAGKVSLGTCYCIKLSPLHAGEVNSLGHGLAMIIDTPAIWTCRCMCWAAQLLSRDHCCKSLCRMLNHVITIACQRLNSWWCGHAGVCAGPLNCCCPQTITAGPSRGRRRNSTEGRHSDGD